MKGLGDIDRRLAVKQDQLFDASLTPPQALSEDDPGLAQLLAALYVINIFRNAVGVRGTMTTGRPAASTFLRPAASRWQATAPKPSMTRPS